jgi:hypothetical protein
MFGAVPVVCGALLKCRLIHFHDHTRDQTVVETPQFDRLGQGPPLNVGLNGCAKQLNA